MTQKRKRKRKMQYETCHYCPFCDGDARRVDPNEKAECRERFKEYWDYLP